MEGYYDYERTHRLRRHLTLVSFLNSVSRAVGQSLSALTGTGIVVLEEAVQHRAGASTGEIVAKDGLPSFRDAESMELRRAIASSPPSILVLGEGALSSPVNRDLVRRETYLVYLRPSASQVKRDLDREGARNVTLLTEAARVPGDEGDGLDAIVGMRESEYRGALLVVEMARGASHRVVSELVARLEKEGLLAPS